MLSALPAQVPSDGSPPLEVVVLSAGKQAHKWRAGLIGALAAAAVILPLLVYLAMRIKSMNRMVNQIMDQVPLPPLLSSPFPSLYTAALHGGCLPKRRRACRERWLL